MHVYTVCACKVYVEFYVRRLPQLANALHTYTVPVHLFFATHSKGSIWCVVAMCPWADLVKSDGSVNVYCPF